MTLPHAAEGAWPVLSPEELTAQIRLPYAKSGVGIPTPDDLGLSGSEWDLASDHVLVPGPPRPLSLAQVIALFPGQFPIRQPWLTGERFCADAVVQSGWLAVLSKPIPGSQDLSVTGHLALLREGERLPNAAELAWAISAFARVRNRRILPRTFLRTASLTNEGASVFVGALSSEGLLFKAFEDEGCSARPGWISATACRTLPDPP